jgi:hypothetical protein
MIARCGLRIKFTAFTWSFATHEHTALAVTTSPHELCASSTAGTDGPSGAAHGRLRLRDSPGSLVFDCG